MSLHCIFCLSHYRALILCEIISIVALFMKNGVGYPSPACADPEGGTGGPDPPWNLKILPKKR